MSDLSSQGYKELIVLRLVQILIKSLIDIGQGLGFLQLKQIHYSVNIAV